MSDQVKVPRCTIALQFIKNYCDGLKCNKVYQPISELKSKMVSSKLFSKKWWLLHWKWPIIIGGSFHTPARTLSISGLKSRVLKLSFLSLQMMVKSGLEFILKLTKPLQRYLLTCQANSALLGRFFCTGQQQLWRGSVNFKINSRPLFTIIFKLESVISRLEILVYL